MYLSRRIIALVPANNEEAKIGRVVDRIHLNAVDAQGTAIVDRLLVIDDGSTDATAQVARNRGAEVMSLPRTLGVGAALRAGLEAGRRDGFDIAVILAGNDKDEPAEMPRLLDPICDGSQDFVIGSRYLPGGLCGGDIPKYRRWATKLHPWMMSRFVGKRLTESTNGFRALRLSLLADPRISLKQRWLDSYGLEVYLLWKVITLGYRHAEVPCSKVYPPKALGYTKMKAGIGWWSILRPVFLLGLGIRR